MVLRLRAIGAGAYWQDAKLTRRCSWVAGPCPSYTSASGGAGATYSQEDAPAPGAVLPPCLLVLRSKQCKLSDLYCRCYGKSWKPWLEHQHLSLSSQNVSQDQKHLAHARIPNSQLMLGAYVSLASGGLLLKRQQQPLRQHINFLESSPCKGPAMSIAGASGTSCSQA